MSEDLLLPEPEETNFPANRREFLGAISAALLMVNALNVPAGSRPDKKMNDPNNKIDFLKNYPTSLIENAIYLLKGTHEGITLTRPGLERRTQNAGTLAGYAVTSVYSTEPDDARGRRETGDYWNYVFSAPGPKIAVSVDAGKEPGTGSSWGMQNAHIHKGLGCRGVITNGGARDIGVFREIGLQVFSGFLTAGHGNPHFIDFGNSVALYGAKINSGDIICADEHGAIVVPAEFLPVIEQAVAETLRRIDTVAQYCQKKDFSPAGLAEVIKKLKPATPWKPVL